MPQTETWKAAEFFAGIGLVRLALEQAGVEVVWSNDIEPQKFALYEANFGAEDFVLGDVRLVEGDALPDVQLATASFPCTDLSLAGNRAGLAGTQSSMFWEFARILTEMGSRRPRVVLLENVPGFATSRGGQDLRDAIVKLNDLGYTCDVFVVDAQHFVPQSRERMFVVGCQDELVDESDWTPSELRPPWVQAFVRRHGGLKMQAMPLELAHVGDLKDLSSVIERFGPADPIWWEPQRVRAFVGSLSPVQRKRLDGLTAQRRYTWRTAYRRTRNGVAVWEIRPDAISGCLRTARGGSSKQAVVQAGRGEVRVRWMTAREYARLQGAPSFKLGAVSERQALYGFGDAVCVPVISWITETYLKPALARTYALADA